MCDRSRDGGVSLKDKVGLDGVGLGGGHGTSNIGAGLKGGGSGEEYDDQDVEKVRIIEEYCGNGGTGADSSEDVRGMEGIAGGRLGGDGTGDCRIGGIDGKQRPHVSRLRMALALIFVGRQMLSLFTLSSKGVWEFHCTRHAKECVTQEGELPLDH